MLAFYLSIVPTCIGLLSLEAFHQFHIVSPFPCMLCSSSPLPKQFDPPPPHPHPVTLIACQIKYAALSATITSNNTFVYNLFTVTLMITKDQNLINKSISFFSDSFPIMIDRQSCHNLIRVTSEGRGMSFSGAACPAPEHPLQFDKVCCALGSSPITAGQSYWEVNVRCCSAWAVGVAYDTLERKGNDKGAKLGRNRNSWCVEFQNRNLTAWHNNRHISCQGVGQTPIRKVGVWVNYDKGQLIFYDAKNMVVLQKFSAAMTPVFDRAHHQFTQPLYPAIRFLRPPDNQVWPNHLEFCSQKFL